MTAETTNPTAHFPLNMGDEYSFDWTFRNFYAQLCTFAERYLKNKEDAEEAVENVFLKLWNKKEVFEGLDHTRFYLYRAVYNSSLKIIRSNLRQVNREQVYGMQIDFTEESYLTNMLRTERIGIIYREIENLPEHCSKVIQLSFKDGLKNEEIALKLGLSLQTVKNYKTKGLAIVKGKLPKDAWAVLYLGTVLSIFYNK